jgi:hypothetical protein
LDAAWLGLYAGVAKELTAWRAKQQAGESVKALRRFNDLLEGLSAEQLDTQMWRVWNEMAFNLESFNPVFTACLLKVQCTLGATDYVRRDECLRSLIQPLAGEYGMHNGEPMGKTHRKLFSEFYTSVRLRSNRVPPGSVVQ